MKKILAALLLARARVCLRRRKAPLDRAPIDLHDKASLQRGAQIFVNHCLNCHSAGSMRYCAPHDIGLTEEQIRDNLLFTREKVGETMATALDPKIAKAASASCRRTCRFAALAQPRLALHLPAQLLSRSGVQVGLEQHGVPERRDAARALGIPGRPGAAGDRAEDEHTGDTRAHAEAVRSSARAHVAARYDQYVADLVNYLAYMAEPAQATASTGASSCSSSSRPSSAGVMLKTNTGRRR
jgi:ubiquinol-cytochrome c reductase cytochrome c1 subunit